MRHTEDMKRVAITFSNREKVRPYEEAVRQAGAEPVLVWPDAPRHLAGMSGLLLTGGTDVDPSRYGEQQQHATEQPDAKRDLLEQRLLTEAAASDLPVLAICRGLQMLNVDRGGTLYQDIQGHRSPGVDEAHLVEIVPESRIAQIIGCREYPVNSRHHQAVNLVGSRLDITARAPDGTVEGLEDPSGRFIVAVQWHPEDRVATHPGDRALFAAFVEAL